MANPVRTLVKDYGWMGLGLIGKTLLVSGSILVLIGAFGRPQVEIRRGEQQ